MLAQRETSKKCPEFKYAPPFILLENDVIVHLHWNAPQQRGGKEYGDVDWPIIVKPHLLSTQGLVFDSQVICNMVTGRFNWINDIRFGSLVKLRLHNTEFGL